MNSATLQYSFWQDYFGTPHSSVPNVDSTELRKATFPEILNYAIPQEQKLIVFNRLIEDISIAQNKNSLVKRDDFKVSELITLLSDILDVNWSNFSPEIKILLLDKLQVFNKSDWQIAFSIIINSFTLRNFANNLNRYRNYVSEYSSFDNNDRRNISQSTFANLGFVYKSLSNLRNVTRRFFKEDGDLLKKNKRSILEIIESLQVVSPQSFNIYDNDGIVHTYNYKGEPFKYDIRDLYSHPDAYDYMKEQEEKFQSCLAKLIEQYSNQYVIFEDGLVIDSDVNEINLLVRISKNLAYRNRPVAFCKFIPSTLDSTKVHA
jgi:hypothetical protein